MLTNAMETQMVLSLGVKIGGRKEAVPPMEMVSKYLSGAADSVPEIPERYKGTSQSISAEEVTEGKCPFSGMVEEALAKGNPDEITWTKEATERMERIPEFAQPMAKKGIEMHAIENGYTEINDTVMDEVKGRFGM